MKRTPRSRHFSAKAAFSDKNPYPGWTASAPISAARSGDRLAPQVALGRGRRADAVGLVGQEHGQGVAVGVGVDHRTGDAQFAQAAEDTHRDLAPVGDQDFSDLLRLGLAHGWQRMIAARAVIRGRRQDPGASPSEPGPSRDPRRPCKRRTGRSGVGSRSGRCPSSGRRTRRSRSHSFPPARCSPP